MFCHEPVIGDTIGGAVHVTFMRARAKRFFSKFVGVLASSHQSICSDDISRCEYHPGGTLGLLDRSSMPVPSVSAIS